MAPLPAVTAVQTAALPADVVLLPIGSYEQHGRHLPLATDAIIAATITHRLAVDHGVRELPPITISCSHEHEGLPGFPGTVSISATTLLAVIGDIRASLQRAGIQRVVLVNAHGGNYVLNNVVQEANAARPRSVGLFPRSDDWVLARSAANMQHDHREDMHAGELETSIMLHEHPDMVDEQAAKVGDFDARDRPDLLVHGMAGYAENGVIGFPSAATAAKGSAALASLSRSFESYLQLFREPLTAT